MSAPKMEKQEQEDTIVSSPNPKVDTDTGKKPYFGLRGNALNAWVNVACITAMCLFGKFSNSYAFSMIR
jgi:hypothetical protein